MSRLDAYKRYLQDNPRGYWFRAKVYGWGWVPVRWQGWVVVLVYVALLLLSAFTIDESSSSREVVFTFFLPLVLLTGALIRIAYRTGERPHWQWGVPDKYKDK